jgi:hypothetical protein
MPTRSQKSVFKIGLAISVPFVDVGSMRHSSRQVIGL